MNAAFMETAAHGLGTLRIGGRSVPGQGRLVDSLGKLAGWINGECATVSPWPGVRFETNLTDRIQRQMWAGTYEPHVRACFEALIKPGHVYFDVGGHIGYHAVAAAHWVGESGRVFAFEADPVMYERLARNLRQFPWAQATHAAVWDHSGTLTFSRSPVAQESGWGTLSEVRDFGNGEHLDVRAISLDDWCRDARVTRWDVMKLDAEGSELAVLQGAQTALEKFLPVMMIEINGILLKEAGISPVQVVGFLTARGYRLFSLSYGRLEPWNLASHGDFSDTICLPDFRAAEALNRLTDAGFTLVDTSTHRAGHSQSSPSRAGS
jgi:FkbM family methyltransferase